MESSSFRLPVQKKYKCMTCGKVFTEVCTDRTSILFKVGKLIKRNLSIQHQCPLCGNTKCLELPKELIYN